ncbi:MAG: hypothetical protein M1821_009635 [Bathelium mastoideum]|nr:MAG: hypothetical protein M1821_009635 [Bathelium mastoideum]KAI9688861.1 MAG: hypothetical protein M1822_001218 [Bathelium mastoideum]
MESDDITQELSTKLEKELLLENDSRDKSDVSTTIKDYLNNADFKVGNKRQLAFGASPSDKTQIQDVPGQEEVVLSRKYGDENIRVTFSVADLNTFDQEQEEMDQDRALYDEEADMEGLPTDTQSGGANTKGAVNRGRTAGGNIKVAPEDSVAPADRPELANDESPVDDTGLSGDFPARLNITVNRDGKEGALAIEATAQQGNITIDNVYYFPTVDMADPKTADLDWQRRGQYMGPPFGNLDEDLQVLMENWIESRGINTELALFVVEYIDYKEQREYKAWLENLGKFFD